MNELKKSQNDRKCPQMNFSFSQLLNHGRPAKLVVFIFLCFCFQICKHLKHLLRSVVGQSERFRVIEIQKCEICFFSPFMLTLFPHFCTTFIKSPFLGQSWSTNYCCTCPAPVEFDPSLNVKRFEKIKFLVNTET